MDIELRQAERAFLTGDVDAGLKVLHRLLRSGRLSADSLTSLIEPLLENNHHNISLKTNLLAIAFQTGLLDEQASETLVIAAYPEFRPPPGEDYEIVGRAPCLNVFLDRYPVASLDLWGYDVLARAWPWLYTFYTTGVFKSEPREVYDIAQQERITLPPKNILINVSAEPPFDIEAGRPIPPRNYDPYVSLYLVDSFEDIEPPSEEPVEMKHWLNCYERGQSYGGPEEGGWYRDIYSPLATLYVGYQEEYMHFDDRPDYVQDAADFLRDIYEDDQGSGVPIGIQLETHSMQYHVYPEGGYE